MRGGADPEGDAPGDGVLRKQSLQLRAEQVRREAEVAGLLVEHAHQVVAYDVLVGVCWKFWGCRIYLYSYFVRLLMVTTMIKSSS